MDIEKLIEQLRKSADFEDYPIVASFAAIIEKKYLRDAATALSTLRAENEKLRAELEQVREDNKKLCSAMMTIRRSENSERMCAEYRVDYCTALSHQETADLARIAFEGLMREDERMRGPQKED